MAFLRKKKAVAGGAILGLIALVWSMHKSGASAGATQSTGDFTQQSAIPGTDAPVGIGLPPSVGGGVVTNPPDITPTLPNIPDIPDYQAPSDYPTGVPDYPVGAQYFPPIPTGSPEVVPMVPVANVTVIPPTYEYTNPYTNFGQPAQQQVPIPPNPPIINTVPYVNPNPIYYGPQPVLDPHPSIVGPSQRAFVEPPQKQFSGGSSDPKPLTESNHPLSAVKKGLGSILG
jgi:hypothetical protein